MIAHLSAEELTTYLEEDVCARIEELDTSLSSANRTPDVVHFLRRVRETRASGIRPAPVAAQRAMAKTRNPDISITQLVQIVEEDPALCQALLKYANSAYYATGGSAIVSLKHAAQRVGTSGVHNVVLSTMLDGMMCKPGGAFQAMVDQARTHMIRTAPLARAIAPGFAVAPDDAFALALLHDVGKLFVFDVIGDIRHERRRDANIPVPVVSHVLRLTHAALGGIAALTWGLGKSAAVAIATHHRTPAPKDENRMSEVLFIAERAEHAVNGVWALDFETWWRDGQLPGTTSQTYELFGRYSAREMAA